MIAPQIKPLSFEEFLEWYPNDEQRYELIEGVIVEMLPTGSHEDIAGFLVAELNLEIRRQNLPYSIPKNCLLKPLAPRSGYLPVDYRALGAVRYIGKPKQPTVTICQLIEGEYQMEKFVQGDYAPRSLTDRLKSSVFPELELTAEAVFHAISI
jgi:hypothetical protein